MDRRTDGRTHLFGVQQVDGGRHLGDVRGRTQLQRRELREDLRRVHDRAILRDEHTHITVIPDTRRHGSPRIFVRPSPLLALPCYASVFRVLRSQIHKMSPVLFDSFDFNFAGPFCVRYAWLYAIEGGFLPNSSEAMAKESRRYSQKPCACPACCACSFSVARRRRTWCPPLHSSCATRTCPKGVPQRHPLCPEILFLPQWVLSLKKNARWRVHIDDTEKLNRVFLTPLPQELGAASAKNLHRDAKRGTSGVSGSNLPWRLRPSPCRNFC